MDYILELSSPYNENKNNNINSEEGKFPENFHHKKIINVHNNVIINEYDKNDKSPHAISFGPKYIDNKTAENNTEKISNTIESANNNNFTNMINQNYQYESGILRNDSKIIWSLR